MDSSFESAFGVAELTPAVFWGAFVFLFGAFAAVRQFRALRREPPRQSVPAWDATLPQLTAFVAAALFCLLGVGILCAGAARKLFPDAELQGNLSYLVPVMQPLALVAILVFIKCVPDAFPKPLDAARERGAGARGFFSLLSLKDAFGVPAFFGAAVFAVTLATLATLGVVSFLPEEIRAMFQERQQLVEELSSPGRALAFALSAPAIAIVTPILEELIFRVGIYRFLKSRMPAVAAAIISSVIFAALHDAAVSFLPLTVLGCVLCFAYEKTGRVAAPMLIHAFFNANTLLCIAIG